jgi:hypothetical protein
VIILPRLELLHQLIARFLLERLLGEFRHDVVYARLMLIRREREGGIRRRVWRGIRSICWRGKDIIEELMCGLRRCAERKMIEHLSLSWPGDDERLGLFIVEGAFGIEIVGGRGLFAGRNASGLRWLAPRSLLMRLRERGRVLYFPVGFLQLSVDVMYAHRM